MENNITATLDIFEPKEQIFEEKFEKLIARVIGASTFPNNSTEIVKYKNELKQFIQSEISQVRKEAIKEFWEAVKLERKKEFRIVDELGLSIHGYVVCPCGTILKTTQQTFDHKEHLDYGNTYYNQAIFDITKKTEEYIEKL